MKRIRLERIEDVNNTSGTGNVWEGVVFDNGWISGRWMTNTPTYGWYPSIEHVEKIHGHGGKTQIVDSEYGQLIEIRTEPEYTTDDNPVVAQGYICANGWITLLHLAKYTSVYWYRNMDELELIIGARSVVIPYYNRIFYSAEHSIWQRDLIFKENKQVV